MNMHSSMEQENQKHGLNKVYSVIKFSVILEVKHSSVKGRKK